VYFHDAYLWEDSIRVPLIMRLPGVAPRVIDRPASLLDLAPTLAAYLGLSAPATFQGHDWLTHPSARSEPVVAEVSGNDSFGGVGRPARHAVIGPRYKLTLDVTANLFELYDLARDPRELHPLPQSTVSAAAELRAFLARWQDAPGCTAP
jgi:arylsulfatase A-like enzyme